MDISQLRTAMKTCQDDLLKKANVVSVGIGYKTEKGQSTDQLCLVVGVSKKLIVAFVADEDVIPENINGIPLDVQEVGFQQINPKKGKKKKLVKPMAVFDPKQRHRPMMPGISVGHKNVTCGSIGLFVKRDGQNVLLSNNHVLAAVNSAIIGDAIFQPGVADYGTSEDQIGTLLDFVPIVMEGAIPPPPTPPPTPPPAPPSSCKIAKAAAATANFVARILGHEHRLMAYNPMTVVANYVDAAIALLTEDFINEIPQIGIPTELTEPALGMSVQKYGRTTQYTTSIITQIYATVNVSYGVNKTARFEDQIMTGDMSDGGDSGSAVLDMNCRVVGLLFAGSNVSTTLNPMHKVFDALNLTL